MVKTAKVLRIVKPVWRYLDIITPAESRSAQVLNGGLNVLARGAIVARMTPTEVDDDWCLRSGCGRGHVVGREKGVQQLYVSIDKLCLRWGGPRKVVITTQHDQHHVGCPLLETPPGFLISCNTAIEVRWCMRVRRISQLFTG